MVTLTGYTDRWSVRAGERVAFHVHSAEGGYEAQLVGLIHGDENPAGPGFKEIPVDSPLNGRHRGESRHIAKGSCAVVPLPPALREDAPGWSLAAWVWPTPVDGQHALIATGDLLAWALTAACPTGAARRASSRASPGCSTASRERSSGPGSRSCWATVPPASRSTRSTRGSARPPT